MTGRHIDLSKRKAILSAATRLFLKNGFSSTSMDDVARAAKVTKQTVYSHFSSKDNLFREMIAAQCLKHSPDAAMIQDSSLPIERFLFAVGRGFLEMISSKDGLAIHRLVMSEAQRKPSIAKLFYETGPQRMNDLLTDYLTLQTRRGTITIEHPQSAASYFYSLLKGRFHLRMALNIKPLPTKQELAEHVKETVTIFLRLYCSDSLMNQKNMSD